jgi:6-phosphogluconolactonase
MKITPWDERRDYIILESHAAAVAFMAEHWLHVARRAIQQRGLFAVALAGGATPLPVYRILAEKKDALPWDKVWLFWSDERAVPPDDPNSNYRNAMNGGLGALPIPSHQIFRMVAEKDREREATIYEETIRDLLGNRLFDLVMLGMGEDGHVASLFPTSDALHETSRLVVPVFLPQKNVWRMTCTFPCLDQSAQCCVCVFGASKGKRVAQVLAAPLVSSWPASRVGVWEHKALWILDDGSGKYLQSPGKV